MHRWTAQSLIALNLVGCLTLLTAAAPVLGVVTARGSFTLDRAAVTGNATVFEGSTVETDKIASEIRLTEGPRIRLAAGSRGVIYRDRLVLERGEGAAERMAGYSLEVQSLRIRSAKPAAGARVSLIGANLVEVSAVGAEVRVANLNGVVLANVAAGGKLSFTPEQAGAAAPSSVTGCLKSSDGHFSLTDEASGATFVLLGNDVAQYAGNRVQVDGAVKPGEPDSNRLMVTSLTVLAKKCPARSARVAKGAGGAGASGTGASGTAAGGAGAGGAGAGTAGATAGMAVATKAIIAGVIVAGAAAGGAVAAVAASEETGDVSPSSR